jgi:hypothetical protein
MKKNQKGFRLSSCRSSWPSFLLSRPSRSRTCFAPRLPRTSRRRWDLSVRFLSGRDIFIHLQRWLHAYPCAIGWSAGGASSCANARLIDEVLPTAPNQKSGYTFTFTPNGTVTLTAGVPASVRRVRRHRLFGLCYSSHAELDGTTCCCVDEAGVVRVNAPGVLIAPLCSGSGFPPLQYFRFTNGGRKSSLPPFLSLAVV